MTKDEYLEGLVEMCRDMASESSDMNRFILEGEAISIELREHDPELADAIMASCDKMKDIKSIMKRRLMEFEGRA